MLRDGTGAGSSCGAGSILAGVVTICTGVALLAGGFGGLAALPRASLELGLELGLTASRDAGLRASLEDGLGRAIPSLEVGLAGRGAGSRGTILDIIFSKESPTLRGEGRMARREPFGVHGSQ